jgi:hypothetical protein
MIVDPKTYELFQRIGEARIRQLPLVLSPDDLETLIGAFQQQMASFNEIKELAQTSQQIIASYEKLLDESKAREKTLQGVAESAIAIAKKLGDAPTFEQLYKPVGKA